MKKTVTPRTLDYRNPFMEIHHTRADFGNFQKEYYVVDLGPRAGVVAIREGRILMTKQYRFLIDGFSWEIPGGRVDAGETPAAAAARECIEETGVKCVDLHPLVEYYPGLDNFNNRTSLFYSTQVEIVKHFVADDAEVVEISWMEIGEVLDKIFRGEIMDALTVSGLLAYQAHAGRSNDCRTVVKPKA